MDFRKWLLWLAVMLAAGLLYSVATSAAYLDVLKGGWPIALLSALVIYFAAAKADDPHDPWQHWMPWAVVMGVIFIVYGALIGGSAWSLFTLWHLSLAFVSAAAMYFVVPWSEKHLPA